MDTNTSGTLYFDDPSTGSGQASNRVDSRTLALSSEAYRRVGTLTDPGVDDPQATNQAGWFARTYQYSATIPHAVTNVTPETGSPDTYEYDLNGNMICRVEGGVTFKQDYNAENRISAIHKMNGNCSTGTVTESWLYGYDGDGVRVSTAHYTGVTLDSLTLYYMGGAYEVTGSAVKKYYSMAGQTIMRDSDGSLKYLLTDHLGSTSAVTNQNGTLLSQQRYLPFGEVRSIPNSPYITQTDFGYTFQRNLSGTGLMDYRARFYSSGLGRFIQPDSIISNPANPQAYNRYSYVGNRPFNFTDPTGHVSCSSVAEEDCAFEDKTWEEMYGISISKSFKPHERLAILKAVSAVGSAFARVLDGEAGDLFQQVFGEVNFERCTDCSGFGRTSSRDGGRSHTIYIEQIYTSADALNRSTRLVVHELGHAFNNVLGGSPSTDIPSALLRPNSISGYEKINGKSYPIYSIDHGNPANDFWGYAGGMNNWQFGFETTLPGNEEFADMFVGWTYNTWGEDVDVENSLAYQRRQHMGSFMPAYLGK